MRIVASSQSGLVEEDAAMWLLTERAVLTSNVCFELAEAAPGYGGRRPSAALRFLRQWLADHLDIAFAAPDEGIDEMFAPEKGRSLHHEIRAGARSALRSPCPTPRAVRGSSRRTMNESAHTSTSGSGCEPQVSLDRNRPPLPQR